VRQQDGDPSSKLERILPGAEGQGGVSGNQPRILFVRGGRGEMNGWKMWQWESEKCDSRPPLKRLHLFYHFKKKILRHERKRQDPQKENLVLGGRTQETEEGTKTSPHF